jgi:hypothetical protein
MNTALRVTALLAGLSASAALMAAESPGCPDVKFSPSVLEKFPRAQEACLDVITKGGQQYAVFKADLTGVQGNTVRVRVRLPDGSYSDTKSIRTKPDLHVLIDGKAYSVSELAPNQELTTYIRVDQPMIALAPANQSDPVDAVPMAATEPETPQPRSTEHLAAAAPVMPHTASQTGLALLTGLFCMAVAFALRISRRRG